VVNKDFHHETTDIARFRTSELVPDVSYEQSTTLSSVSLIIGFISANYQCVGSGSITGYWPERDVNVG